MSKGEEHRKLKEDISTILQLHSPKSIREPASPNLDYLREGSLEVSSPKTGGGKGSLLRKKMSKSSSQKKEKGAPLGATSKGGGYDASTISKYGSLQRNIVPKVSWHF